MELAARHWEHTSPVIPKALILYKLLLDEVVGSVVDDSLNVLDVDMPVNDNQGIGHHAGIRKNELSDVLAIATCKHHEIVVATLIGHYFLVVAVLIKILQMFAELITDIATTFTQIKHLHRIDADTRF